MKSVSHLKIQPRNFPFPLWRHIMSVPPWCWSNSLSTCHVWDPSPHLSQARSTGTWLTPHTHAHSALRHTAGRFLTFPSPLGGFDIYLFLCMCHKRQSKTDSSGFKLLRKEQTVFSLMVQLSTGWVFLLGKCSLQEQPVKGQFWEHSSDSKVSLPGARSLLREGRHCSKCSALSSFLIGKALHDSSNTAIPLPLGREYLLSCFNATCCSLLKANQSPAWQWNGKAIWVRITLKAKVQLRNPHHEHHLLEVTGINT